MVELCRRYSNRPELLGPLVSVLNRVSNEAPATEEEGQLLSADGPAPQVWQVSDRLSPTDVKTLVASYLAGSTSRALAKQYGIKGPASVRMPWSR